jgi:hypothetical protein
VVNAHQADFVPSKIQQYGINELRKPKFFRSLHQVFLPPGRQPEFHPAFDSQITSANQGIASAVSGGEFDGGGFGLTGLTL